MSRWARLHVVELGQGPQVLLPMAPGALLGFGERLLQTLELDQLRCRLGRHRGRLARGALPIASGLVGSHLAKPSGKSRCRPAPAVRAAYRGVGISVSNS